VNLPALEDVAEILSEKKSYKDSSGVNHINPAAVMAIVHQLKGLP
jgi:hypothetical protein